MRNQRREYGAGGRAGGGAGHGPGSEPGERPASVRALLHYQTRGHGHGLIDLPLDYRSPWWAAVGDQVRAAGCSLSVYGPCRLSGRIVIESMSLIGTQRTCRPYSAMSGWAKRKTF